MPLPVPTASRPLDPLQGSSGPVPKPGVLEGIGANFRVAQRDVPYFDSSRRNARLIEAAEELRRIGVLDNSGLASVVNAASEVPVRGASENVFWAALAKARQGKPDLLKGFPGTRKDFDAQWRTEQSRDLARDSAIARETPWWSKVAGGIGASFTDPVNVASLPFGGGGKTVFRQILSSGATNAAVELIEQPLIARERAAQGREYTAAERAANVGFAFGGGVVFDAGMRGAVKLPGLGRSAFERTVAANWERLPPALREKWAARASVDVPEIDIDDALLADTAEAVIGRDSMTPDELDAAALLRREAEIDGTNPYQAGGSGDLLHRTRLNDALARARGDAPEGRAFTGSLTPPAAGRAPAGRISTGLASGAVPAGAEQRFMAKARGAESGGDDGAAALTSSAYGRYQFIRGTWLAYYKRRFGAGGLSDAQIVAKRGDGRLQDVLMADLTADNAAFLRQRGEAVTEGNLYLVHFAGKGGAARVLDAAAEMPLARVLDPGALKANAFLRGMTVGELIEWSARKMGHAPVSRSGPRADVRADFAGDEALARQLQGEADDLLARLGTARAAAADGADNVLTRFDADEALPEIGPPAALADPELRQAAWTEARDSLMARQDGEVPAALYHPEIGPIDLRWGNEKAGLAKIVARHSEVLDDLPARLEEMEIVSRTENRIQMESPDHAAAVRLDWDGKQQSWLLTAFEREEPQARRLASEGVAPSTAVYRRAADDAGASPTAGAISAVTLARQGFKLGDNVGDPAFHWGNQLDRGEPVKPVWAMVDADGTVRGWETTRKRAQGRVDRGGDGLTVREIKPPQFGPAPDMPGPARAFDDPAGPAVQAQVEGLTHDVRAAVDAGEFDGLHFATGGDGAESAEIALARLDADEAALKIVRDCL